MQMVCTVILLIVGSTSFQLKSNQKDSLLSKNRITLFWGERTKRISWKLIIDVTNHHQQIDLRRNKIQNFPCIPTTLTGQVVQRDRAGATEAGRLGLKQWCSKGGSRVTGPWAAPSGGGDLLVKNKFLKVVWRF